MSQFKGTPGPWRRRRVIIQKVDLYMSDFDYDLPKHNTDLIMSAPELLDFAEYVLSLKTGDLLEQKAAEVVSKALGGQN